MKSTSCNSNIQFVSVGKFLSELKKKFGEDNDKLAKVAKLKMVKQGGKIIEE